MGVQKIFGDARARVSSLVGTFREDESGATAIEYGLIVSLIFLAIVGAIKSFTASTSDMYDTIDQTLQNG